MFTDHFKGYVEERMPGLVYTVCAACVKVYRTSLFIMNWSRNTIESILHYTSIVMYMYTAPASIIIFSVFQLRIDDEHLVHNYTKIFDTCRDSAYILGVPPLLRMDWR